MTIICVFVKYHEAKETIKEIEETFPCFVYKELLEDGWTELNINCREEDAVAIEDKLAEWV